MTADTGNRSNGILIFLGGLCGAVGVALSAAAAHVGGSFLGTAASFLLFHAPALVAIGLFGESRWLRLAGFMLGIGLMLFCGDLLARDFLGSRLFPFAAPTGGTLLIAGWLAVAGSAFASARS